jgi:hypothetical protein
MGSLSAGLQQPATVEILTSHAVRICVRRQCVTLLNENRVKFALAWLPCKSFRGGMGGGVDDVGEPTGVGYVITYKLSRLGVYVDGIVHRELDVGTGEVLVHKFPECPLKPMDSKDIS